MKSLMVLFVLFVLGVLVSSNGQVETQKGENNAETSPKEYHVNNGYDTGGGSWGGFEGGGWGGPDGDGGGWGGYGSGYGGLGWDGRGGGYVRGGWGGSGGGGGGWGGGCRYGCCGRWNRYKGCSSCCRSLTEAITFNEQKASP